MGRSVNYFANLGAECYFHKIGCNESNFPKIRRCQCNLSFFLKKKKKKISVFGHLVMWIRALKNIYSKISLFIFVGQYKFFSLPSFWKVNSSTRGLCIHLRLV
jgi:hypothetical protein